MDINVKCFTVNIGMLLRRDSAVAPPDEPTVLATLSGSYKGVRQLALNL